MTSQFRIEVEHPWNEREELVPALRGQKHKSKYDFSWKTWYYSILIFRFILNEVNKTNVTNQWWQPKIHNNLNLRGCCCSKAQLHCRFSTPKIKFAYIFFDSICMGIFFQSTIHNQTKKSNYGDEKEVIWWFVPKKIGNLVSCITTDYIIVPQTLFQCWIAKIGNPEELGQRKNAY